ncbi:hypothetical protein HanRHA438_Chr11g0520981 [Helianthus annuus]|nr:hypothetical protein HanRHA438_Chr11g0520981 [Helianthus annuus]
METEMVSDDGGDDDERDDSRWNVRLQNNASSSFKNRRPEMVMIHCGEWLFDAVIGVERWFQVNSSW